MNEPLQFFLNTINYVLPTKLNTAANQGVLMNSASHVSRAEVKCFPNIFLVGIRKCGTTDIKYWFIKHPHVEVQQAVSYHYRFIIKEHHTHDQFSLQQ